MPRSLPLLVALLALAVTPAVAAAQDIPSVEYPGLQHLQYKYGPIDITPGQNTIEFKANNLKPDVPGYITRFVPNLVRVSDGSIPRVDVLHLHHGVWAVATRRDATAPLFPERFIAAGEEKTALELPDGYGYRYSPNVVVVFFHYNDVLYNGLDNNIHIPKPLLAFRDGKPVVANYPVPRRPPERPAEAAPPPPPTGSAAFEWLEERLERSSPRTHDA